MCEFFMWVNGPNHLNRAQECNSYWDDQDRVGLIKRITEMHLGIKLTCVLIETSKHSFDLNKSLKRHVELNKSPAVLWQNGTWKNLMEIAPKKLEKSGMKLGSQLESSRIILSLLDTWYRLDHFWAPSYTFVVQLWANTSWNSTGKSREIPLKFEVSKSGAPRHILVQEGPLLLHIWSSLGTNRHKSGAKPWFILTGNMLARWWFQFLFISPPLGEGSHFDQYFSNGLKPPTS